MRNLNEIELSVVNGGYGSIRPSEWMWSGAAGATIGFAGYVVTAFSAHPLVLTTALLWGAGIGMGFHASYDILRTNNL